MSRSVSPAAEHGGAADLPPPTDRVVRLPARALAALSRRCGELGAGARSALRDAGRRVGLGLQAALESEGSGSGAPLDEYWEAAATKAKRDGLGRPSYRTLSGAVGLVVLDGSPEVSPPAPEGLGPEPAGSGCSFAAGWIAGLLTGAADRPVSVLEVTCAAHDPEEPCRFLVGERQTLSRVLARLRAGDPPEEAVSSLPGPEPPEAEGP